jgi:hypothetical protein
MHDVQRTKRALTPELALHIETRNPIRNATLRVLIWFSASDKTCCLRRPITLAGTTPTRIARRSGMRVGE